MIDEDRHKNFTGVSNVMILRNLQRLTQSGAQLIIRIPLIPGITDTEDNLHGIFAFMREAGLRRVALLPYNPSAGAKYEWLDRAYELEAEPQDEALLQRLVDLGCSQGLEVNVD